MSIMTAQLQTTEVRIAVDGTTFLNADLTVPPAAKGVVLFAHGSGSGRHSPRNRYVGSELNFLQMATLLADLLTEDEEQADRSSGAYRFDIPLLTHRLIAIIDWASATKDVATLPIGLFGASTGAAAALDAAAQRRDAVRAVVSRGGRVDLATYLTSVTAPTLLIVGGNDAAVLEWNSAACRRLRCVRQLETVPAATHLFEEPGALEAVARSAGAWFQQYLAPDHAVTDRDRA